MEWYYLENGERKGPVDDQSIKNLLSQRKITEDTLVWKAGMPDWLRAKESPMTILFSPPPIPGIQKLL
jgi:hypothetical protein